MFWSVCSTESFPRVTVHRAGSNTAVVIRRRTIVRATSSSPARTSGYTKV